MSLDLKKHPCFCEDAKGSFGRVHLPVAPACNIQCNFCDRRYDCLNESRPGVTSKVLSPGQAMFYLKRTIARDKRISVVGIAGPGDAFATPQTTLETLALVRREYPDMLLCVASNGLNVAPYVDRLAELQTSHVTLTINAVDAGIGEKIVAWVRKGPRTFRGRDAAETLLDSQLAALTALKDAGVVVKVNMIIIPGVNDHHVTEVARTVTGLGADLLNCMPIVPVAGTPFAEVTSPSCGQIAALRAQAAEFLPQMTHCTRCRADAAGLLGQDAPTTTADELSLAAAQPLNPTEYRPFVAVASHEGVLVNQHLGEATRLLLFGRDGRGYEFLEARNTPAAGGGDDRWSQLARILGDCRAVLVSGAGPKPSSLLQEAGLKVIVAEGLVNELLDAVYNGREIRSPVRAHRCGTACQGNATGCG